MKMPRDEAERLERLQEWRQHRHDVVDHSLAHRSRLMEPWSLEQPRTIDRGQHNVEGDAFMMHRQQYVNACRSERPKLPVKVRLTGDLFAVDRENHVTSLEFGARGRPLRGNPDDDDASVDLGGKHSKPGARRLVDTAELSQVIEYRFQEIDRHNHVDMLRLAVAIALKLKRANADQFTSVRNQSCAAPVGMSRMRKD